MRSRRSLVALALLLPAPALAQSVLDAPPNLMGGWVAAPGVVQFNFVHRFDLSPAPVRKLNNTPTFVAAYGATRWATLGFIYGSNSTLVAGYPNEWEWFGRFAALRAASGAPLDLTLQGGYNLAARSADASLTAARELRGGRIRLTGMAGVLGSAFDSGATRPVGGLGAALRQRPGLVLAADVAGLVDRKAGEELTWSAGAQIGIPSTPHSLSLHVTNVGTRTLQGLARGGGPTRVGFEYTVPITLGRYIRRAPAAPQETVEPGADGVVELGMNQIAYERPNMVVPAGTTIRWVNRDPLAHTVTADNGAFDSDLIQPGATWQRRFDTPGTYRYHCTPHPFMRAVVVVR